jgi:hypothetical protein
VRQAGLQHEAEQRLDDLLRDDGGGEQAAREQPGAARGDAHAGVVQRADHGGGVVHDQRRTGLELLQEPFAPGGDLPAQRAAVFGDAPFPAGVGDAAALLFGEAVPVQRAHEQREAVGQRRVQRLRAGVGLVAVLVGGTGVHRRPAVAQPGQRDALHAALVHQREQAVLVLRLAAADLVDQHRLGLPDGGRRLEEAHRARLLLRVREPDQVVEGDQARVVVAVLEFQRLGQRVQQVGLAGAGAADQQQRVLGHQRGQDHRLEAVEAEHAERRQARAWRNGRRGRGASGRARRMQA